MPDEPPWEWVDGDWVLARRFRSTMAASAAVGVGILGLLVLGLVGVVVYPPIWPMVWPGFVFLYVVLNFVLIDFVPRWFPVVARLGISPVGVRFQTGFLNRGSKFDWVKVHEIGTDCIAVSSGYIIRPRYRLTTNQAERLSRFMRVRGDSLQDRSTSL